MSKHKDLRQAHNKATGKYVKQYARTAKNKARHIDKAHKLYEKANGLVAPSA